MHRGTRRLLARAACAAGAAALAVNPLSAFDSKGHLVIEALAYRTLIEGHDGRPPQPDVLRDLLNDGALAPPLCFGWGERPPGYCRDAATSNPLLGWPLPLTDRPDAAFRRQFSDAGQCFHFMAPIEDAQSENIPGTQVPSALATSAVVRCRDLLDQLLRQIVIDGGPGTRTSAFGLYELMHSVGDSFSGAHAERRIDTREIEYLRVWKPLERIAHIPTERSARIPKAVYHNWDDHRDKEYVVEDRVASDGRRCKQLTDYPYEVPYECLSAEGDQARQAVAELLVIVRDLRRARIDAGVAAESFPERAEAWAAYKMKWFTMAHTCSGSECEAKQPPDLLPGAYGLIGLDTTYNSSRGVFDVMARGTLLDYSWELNPFVYGVSAGIGYRHGDSGGSSALAGLDLNLILPLGKRAALGFAPATWRVAFGGSNGGSELATRLFRFDLQIGQKTFLTVNAPIELNWRRPAVEWSFGLGLLYAPGNSQAPNGPLIHPHEEKVERSDETWSPPAAPYGRLEGWSPSWYVGVGVTTVETPAVAIEGREYGMGSVAGTVMWDRDRSGGRFEWAPGASLAIGARTTSGESGYLTGSVGLGLRWYVLRVLGLSVTPIRIEGGPKIRGQSEDDLSPDIHGSPGSQYYFQSGSRVGIAFNAGVVDLLVEAPTIAWRSHPFNNGEVVSFSLAIRLN